ncbi:hypothetical protein BX666DRAFT_1925848 [Dichotomocladium elegans]|nr:hypothetical protein BX666DRAFT_1925848 [Dichotomocladium elegans]
MKSGTLISMAPNTDISAFAQSASTYTTVECSPCRCPTPCECSFAHNRAHRPCENKKRRMDANAFEEVDEFFMAKRIAYYLVQNHSAINAFHDDSIVEMSAWVAAEILSTDLQELHDRQVKICYFIRGLRDTLCTDCYKVFSRKDSLARHKTMKVCNPTKKFGQHMFHSSIV